MEDNDPNPIAETRQDPLPDQKTDSVERVSAKREPDVGGQNSSFVARNWLTIASLVIALFGGLPGLIKLYESVFEKPALRAELPNLVSGNISFDGGKTELTYFLMPLVIANSGRRPVSPGRFIGEAEYSGRWIRLEAHAVPRHTEFGSITHSINVAPDARDLQDPIGVLSENEEKEGLLMFVTDSIPLTEFRAQAEHHFRLRTSDAQGRKYTLDLNYVPGAVSRPMKIPGTGLSTQPKDSLK